MKKLMVLICMLFVLGLLIVTNPSKNDYVSWLKETSMAQTQDNLGKGLISLFGDPLIDSYTESKNFMVFSLYKTHISENNDVNAFGVAHNFIPITQQSEIFIFGFYLILIVFVSGSAIYLVLPTAEKKQISE